MTSVSTNSTIPETTEFLPPTATKSSVQTSHWCPDSTLFTCIQN